jgi:hypothetical protein
MAKTIEGEVISYGDAKKILEHQDPEGRLQLAKKEQSHPEVLYYLATDKDTDVRRSVAANPNTPYQADTLLVEDVDDEVRTEIAKKITRILPDIGAVEQFHLREQVLSIIEKLAKDQLPKIRALVAEEIKTSTLIPKTIVNRLARDAEISVAAPILEYSPLLNDADLKEIIAAGVAKEALVSIAKRTEMSESVADAIANTLEIPAVSALLANKDANIREETMAQIVKQAENVKSLHEPLTDRPNMSQRILKRIAGFVASSLVHKMIKKHKLPEEVADDLVKRSRERINEEKSGDDEEKKMEQKVISYHRRGMLTDEFIVECVDNRRKTMAIHSLALLADLEKVKVERAFTSKDGKLITAIIWKAGLKMRTSLDLQNRMVMVSRAKMVMAKDGLYFPFKDEEMENELKRLGS